MQELLNFLEFPSCSDKVGTIVSEDYVGLACLATNRLKLARNAEVERSLTSSKRTADTHRGRRKL